MGCKMSDLCQQLEVKHVVGWAKGMEWIFVLPSCTFNKCLSTTFDIDEEPNDVKKMNRDHQLRTMDSLL